MPADGIDFKRVVGRQVEAAAKPPDGLVAGGGEKAHVHVRCRDVGIERVDDDRDSHRLEGPASELGAFFGCGGGEFRTKDFGEVNPAFFPEPAISDDLGMAPSTSSLALPLIVAEYDVGIERPEFCDQVCLKILQITTNVFPARRRHIERQSIAEGREQSFVVPMSDIPLEQAGDKRVFVVGCGYLGRAVVELARAKGWVVTALTRNVAKAAELRETYGIEVIVADLDSPEWHPQISAEGVLIVNCVSSGGGGVEGYQKSYFNGMQSVLAWAKTGPARGLIYTGSTSVYPDSDGGWIDEATPVAASTPLNEVLLETENLIAAAVKERILLSGSVLRLAGLYGPGRHYLLDTLRKGAETIPGTGDYYLNLIHRDDAAKAVLCGLEAEREGFQTWNVSDGRPVLKKEIVAWSAKRLDVPMPVFTPERASERMQRRLFANGRPPNRRISSAKLQNDLGWKPGYPSFESGYESLIQAGL